MVTTAIVEQVINKYKARVRIPIFDSAADSPNCVPFEDLDVAIINTFPGCDLHFVAGDVVFVAFENEDDSSPIIIGKLFLDEEFASKTATSSIDIKAGEINVGIKATLPIDTTVGVTTPTDIQNISGSRGNLQGQINLLEERINQLESMIENLTSE